jgi:hypothetical protein
MFFCNLVTYVGENSVMYTLASSKANGNNLLGCHTIFTHYFTDILEKYCATAPEMAVVVVVVVVVFNCQNHKSSTSLLTSIGNKACLAQNLEPHYFGIHDN